MGEVRVPASAKWGAQTQRAVENFPISGLTLEPRLIRALALIKGEAALVNASLNDAQRAEAKDAAEHQRPARAHVAVWQRGSRLDLPQLSY